LNETYLSSKQSEAESKVRVPCPYENTEWAAGPKTAQGKGPAQIDSF